LDFRRRLADPSGRARVATDVDVHVASPCLGEGQGMLLPGCRAGRR
jgi:hypothetical protein